MNSFNSSNWRPHANYKNSLDDVKNQPIPSELYRLRAKTVGKEARILKRLQIFIELSYETCERAAIKIQSCYRGMKRREHFQTVKSSLSIARSMHITRNQVLTLINQKDYQAACDILDQLSLPSLELTIVKGKVLYHLREFGKCAELCAAIIEDNPMEEEIHFLHASALASMKKYSKAYDAIRNVMATIESPSYELLRLHGLVCSKLSPPSFQEALESFNTLVVRKPEDMNSLLQRAICYICLHDWERAVEDLSMILHYQPKLVNVIVLRARVYACQRKWDEARADYRRLLRTDPNSIVALNGLQELEEPPDELPMINAALVAETLKP